MPDLTIVLPYFCNRGMLHEQQRVWASFPDEVRSRLHVVVVDDCSPPELQCTEADCVSHSLASFRAYRLLEKTRWNWLACRNLGAKKATTAWLLLTDIDHVAPLATVRSILEDRDLRADDVHRFKRVTATGMWPYEAADLPPYKPHNDTWLLARDFFFSPRVGGYDERLSGCYGTSGEFTDRLRQAARAVITRHDSIVRYPREVIADASTSPAVYTRKNDPENDEDLRRRKEARDQIPGWKPLHGLTPSMLIYSSVPAEAVA
jgi:hypothetical protein